MALNKRKNVVRFIAAILALALFLLINKFSGP